MRGVVSEGEQTRSAAAEGGDASVRRHRSAPSRAPDTQSPTVRRPATTCSRHRGSYVIPYDLADVPSPLLSWPHMMLAAIPHVPACLVPINARLDTIRFTDL
ncbi:hypothetical protein B5X24_HaOG214576 [Helicoverpa armigera]|nr:hypothetical protein B5X24_HaOG214576 [Helicoverpa armigera]